MLTLGAHARSGSQIAGTRSRRASSASTQASIRSVFARQRRQTLHLLRVGDLDLPARELEFVVHEAGAVHRLDRGADRLVVSSDALAQVLQSISVRRRSATLDRNTCP